MQRPVWRGPPEVLPEIIMTTPAVDNGPISIATRVASHADPPRVTMRIAVACMTRRPSNFESWLQHYVHHIGVCKFILRCEDSDELASLFAKQPWVTLVEATFATTHGSLRDDRAQSVRQANHVRHALERARVAGCTHLLHCDDDELLYLPNGLAELEHEEQRCLRGAIELHARVVEALLPSSCTSDPFVEARAFRHRPAEYTSYGNSPTSQGKSMCRLCSASNDTSGPHHFFTRTTHMGDARSTHWLPPHVAVVLHFESATYEGWLNKFGHAAAVTDFAFYLSSVEACRAVVEARVRVQQQTAPTDVDHAALSDAEARVRSLWCAHKLEPPCCRTLPRPTHGCCVLREHGVTLIAPPMPAQPLLRPQPVVTDMGRFGALPEAQANEEVATLLAGAGLPSRYASLLEAAGVSASTLRGLNAEAMDALGRKLAIPMGHRLRLRMLFG